MTRTFLLAVSIAGILATAARAQVPEYRRATHPVQTTPATGDLATITSTLAVGRRRAVDIEVLHWSPLRLQAVWIGNTGPHATESHFAADLEPADIDHIASTRNMRVIDIEPYAVSGQLRFAALFVDNTGANYKRWQAGYVEDWSTLRSIWQAFGGRIVDIEKITILSRSGKETTYYAYVMIHNTGADQLPWAWGLNQTWSSMASYFAANNVRPYDIEVLPDGRYNFIAVRDGLPVVRLEEVSTAVAVTQIWSGAYRYLDVIPRDDGTLAALLAANDGSIAAYGASCGPVGHDVSGTPSRGETLTFRLTVPLTTWGPATLLLGFRKQHLDLGFLGLTGCSLLHTAEILVPATAAPGVALVDVDIPANLALGSTLYSQFAVPVTGLGLRLTNGVETVFGY